MIGSNFAADRDGKIVAKKVISSEKNEINMVLNSRSIDKNELTIEEVLNKLNNILETSDIKIFNESKNLHYITLNIFYIKQLLLCRYSHNWW